MNKLQKLIKSLEENYKVDINTLLKDYAAKLPVAEIAKNQDTTPYVIRTVLQHLQLKRTKHGRDECLQEHYAMLAEDTLDEYTEKLEDDNEYLFNKIQKLEKQLFNSKQELSLNKRQLKASAKTMNLEEKLLDTFDDILSKRNNVQTSVQVQKVQVPEHKEGLVLVLSDQHIGEVVGDDVSQNTYNYKVALERLGDLLDKLLMFPKQSKKLHVLQCGDTLRGLIHGGLAYSEGSFIESISKAVDYYVYMYSLLSEVYERIEITSITGNHDRVTEDPKTYDKSLDFTRLVDSMVARQLVALGKTNISIMVSDSPYQLVDINTASVLVFHGDTVRSYKAHDAGQRGLLQDLCLGTFKKAYLHAVSGHTHQFSACHNQYGGMNIVNGTLVGSNAFGMTNGMRDICASQTIFFVEPNGNIELVQAVKLN